MALASAAPGTAQQPLEKITLPTAEPWLAQRRDAFAFRHAPGREEVAWFVARRREDIEAQRPGHHELAWADRCAW